MFGDACKLKDVKKQNVDKKTQILVAKTFSDAYGLRKTKSTRPEWTTPDFAAGSQPGRGYRGGVH